MTTLEKLTRREAKACGDKFYRRGKTCKRHHSVYRRTTTGVCQECEPLNALLWREKNLERARARDREYRDADPEKFRARDTARNRAKGLRPFKPGLSTTNPIAHKAKRAKQQRDRRSNNPEKIRREAREYRIINRDRMNARNRRDRVTNPEKYAAQGLRHRDTPCGRLRKMVGQTAVALILGQLSHSRFDLLDYTPEEYRDHIVSTLPKGMSFEQAVAEGYHTDHIVPISYIAKRFPPKTYLMHIGFKIATDLSNLRMIPCAENMKKHASMKTQKQFNLFNNLCAKYGVAA